MGPFLLPDDISGTIDDRVGTAGLYVFPVGFIFALVCYGPIPFGVKVEVRSLIVCYFIPKICSLVLFVQE